jgi:hypothetical protein
MIGTEYSPRAGTFPRLASSPEEQVPWSLTLQKRAQYLSQYISLNKEIAN